MTEATVCEDGVLPQYSTALEENRPIQVGKSLNETQSSLDSAGTVPSANPQRNKLSVDNGLRAMKAAALAVEQSFRLTDTQKAAIQKCFQLIREDTASLNAKMLREKSKRSLQVHELRLSMYGKLVASALVIDCIFFGVKARAQSKNPSRPNISRTLLSLVGGLFAFVEEIEGHSRALALSVDELT